MHLAKTQSGTPTPAPAADEKRRLFRDRDMAVAQRPVVSQLLDRARMQRYLAGLGELGLVNGQTAQLQVGIHVLQVHRLGDPQTGGVVPAAVRDPLTTG